MLTGRDANQFVLLSGMQRLPLILLKQWRHFSFKRTLSCKRAHNLAESLSLWINTSCASFAFLVLCKQ